MNERTLAKHSGFTPLKQIIARVLHQFLPEVQSLIAPLRAAAE
jgi:hypothetical protein